MAKTCPTEDEEAVVLADWLRAKQYPFTHVANEGGYGNKQAMLRGVKAKRMGQSKGYWDFAVYVPIYGITGEIDAYQPLMIELKRQFGGRVSPEQKEWGDIYIASGIPCQACKGAREAIDFIRQFENQKEEF